MSLTEKMARIICEDSSNHGECEKCGFYGSKGCNSMRAAKRLVDAGVAQVVRCKDCVHAKTPGNSTMTGRVVTCGNYSSRPVMRCDDFCSYGERRKEGEQ